MIQDVLISDLKVIEVEGGNVLHSSKLDDTGFKKFGECYFSYIDYRFIKGWKRHSVTEFQISPSSICCCPFGLIRMLPFAFVCETHVCFSCLKYSSIHSLSYPTIHAFYLAFLFSH